MLCKYCRSLDLDAACDEELGALHHESYADLVASAENGCELCVYIVASAERLSTNFPGRKDFQNGGVIKCFYRDSMSALRWSQCHPVYGEMAVLRICTTEDDPMRNSIRCRPVCFDATSELSIAQMKSWISTCSAAHSSCHPHGRLPLPTRVIDVGDSVTSPSLLISNGQYGNWVALSYCWGKLLPLRTVSSNLEEFRREISFEILPKLFQDAIILIRRLGYRYLWIDAICIIQDSKTDWLRESARMGDVFEGATLTIAAEHAKDSSVGLCVNMGENRVHSSIVIPTYSQRVGIRGRVFGGIKPTGISGPLSSRAWTFQEELLSPCVLRFAKNQMWWQCREALRSEAYPDSLSRDTARQEWATFAAGEFTSKLNRVLFQSRYQHSPSYLWKSWYTAVGYYCGRRMTYAKDVFPAISGIAKQYHKIGLQDYKAGLWLDDIHRGLLWTTFGGSGTRRTPYVAPSWSWASVEGARTFRGVEYQLIQEKFAPVLQCVAKIECVDVTLLSDDPFGQIKAGKLVIKGPSKEICRDKLLSGFLDYRNSETHDDVSYFMLQEPLESTDFRSSLCNYWTVERFERRSPNPQNPCLLLHVASHQNPKYPQFAFCLVLEVMPDGEVEKQEQTESRDTTDRSKQSQHLDTSASKGSYPVTPSRKRKREKSVEGRRCIAKTRMESVRYRRIGLAILQETVPTYKIWPNRTVTII